MELWESHTVSPIQHTSPKKKKPSGPTWAPSRQSKLRFYPHDPCPSHQPLHITALTLSLPISETRSEARPQNHHLLPFNLSHLHVRRASCTSSQVRAPDSNWRRRRNENPNFALNRRSCFTFAPWPASKLEFLAMSVAELKERHVAASETVNSLRERLKEKRASLLDTDGMVCGFVVS